MNRLVVILIGFCFAVPFAAGNAPARPRITGIAYVKIYASDLDKASNFYSIVQRSTADSSAVGEPCDWCERAPVSLGNRKGLRRIEIEPLGSVQTANLLMEIGFATENVEKLRKFLLGQHLQAEKLTKCEGIPCFGVLDPEQHRLVFLQSAPTSENSTGLIGAYSPGPLPKIRIIHAGFIVKDRAAEDKFYRDILGFRPYWHGGMKDDETSWVSLQVPDGTDWLEFMLYDPTGKDKHFLGVMNHIALGVTDIHATQEQLRKNGAPLTEEPKIGRDGKWQLNLYDPDQTRIEFMEFTPVQKPCCSEFTAPHPKP